MNDFKPIRLRQDREFGQAISDLIAFFKQNFKPLMGLYVRYSLSILVVGFIAGMALNSVIGSTTSDAFSFMGGVGSFLFVFTFMISVLILTAAIFAYVEGYEEGGTIQAAKDNVPVRIWSNVGNILLVYLAMIMVFAFAGLFIFVLVDFFGTWTALLLLPLSLVIIFYSIRFMLTPFITTQKDYSVITAFRESYFLTEDKWWWTFGLYFIISMMGSILMYVIMIPLMIIMMIPMFVGGLEGDMSSLSSSMLITNFITYSAYMIYGMVLIILIPFMYYSLHDRKYGTQIEDRIEQVERKRDSLFENEGEV